MTFKVVCVNNSGLEGELVVGKLYDAELEDTSRPNRSDWFFLVNGVANRGNKDNRFNHYRFKRVSDSFIAGYKQVTVNVESIPVSPYGVSQDEWAEGYKTAMRLILKPDYKEIVTEKGSFLGRKHHPSLFENDRSANVGTCAYW